MRVKDRTHYLHYRLRNESVDDGRDAEAPYSLTRLRYVYRAHRRRSIGGFQQLLSDRRPCLPQVSRKFLYGHPVDSRCSFVGLHPLLTAHDQTLANALERLVDRVTRGDPMGPWLWTCSSAARLATELTAAGHPVSERTVNRLLHELGYSLQANRKTLEGKQHADRDAQFNHINRRVRALQRLRQPVVSVETKKKELIGQFRNGGREWRPQGDPQRVKVHDFVDKELGKAIPYGVYDVTRDSGWVSVGEDHDTAAFAVETLRRWWLRMGSVAYPQVKRLLITADGGGSNSSRSRLWKVELQKFADASGLCISVCHFPPGTSKWNKIEHRMFCHIAENWRRRPLTSRQVVW